MFVRSSTVAGERGEGAAHDRIEQADLVYFVMGGLILIFGHADGQQTPPPVAPNPYLMGSEGYDKGPRGLWPKGFLPCRSSRNARPRRGLTSSKEIP